MTYSQRHHIKGDGEKNKHTSLGEEGAETLIGILSLALLSEVTIGLYGEKKDVVSFAFWSRGRVVNNRLKPHVREWWWCTWIPCSRQ